MIAHLGDGYYSDENIADAPILEEATAQQMHGTLFAYDPRLNGLAYAFWVGNDTTPQFRHKTPFSRLSHPFSHHHSPKPHPDPDFGSFLNIRLC